MHYKQTSPPPGIELANRIKYRYMTTSELTKAAQLLGRKGGLAKTPKKGKAVRENGKLGGRPPKAKNGN